MRFLILCFTLSLTFIATPLLTGAAVDRPPVTFNRDVLPILQRSCQECHRPGEVTPISLLTYREVQPRARTIRDAVLQKRMPPWFADSQHGKFANDRSLSDADIATLVAWADGGAPEGDAADQPPPRPFVEGWNIGRPDVVFKMPKAFHVPASGTINYQHVIIPTGFTEDRWVQMAEVRPGNRTVVHHAAAFIREPGSPWLRWVKPGEPFEARHLHAGRLQKPGSQQGRQRVEEGVRDPEFLTSHVPGSIPMMLKPGQAKLIKAGSDLVFELHYSTNGKADTDRTSVGLIFAKEPPIKRVLTRRAMNWKFAIPAGAPNHRVDAELTLPHDATLLAMLPHMHARGKAVQYRAVYPTGKSRILLDVPRYNFKWQLAYYLEEPPLLPKGTRIECTGNFDNSLNNPNNPDPTVEVRPGLQSWDEMMLCYMDLAVDASLNSELLLKQE